MTLLTIEEAAAFLRLKKRTLHLHKEIPRVKIGGRVCFVQEDLEEWVRARRIIGAAPVRPATAPVSDLVDKRGAGSYNRPRRSIRELRTMAER